MMMSETEQEQLLMLVAQLTDQYTSRESTSIPYEKARMLMEAVLYCIHEYEGRLSGGNVLKVEQGSLDVSMQYKLGYELVLQKVRQANTFYNQLSPHFSAYGNRCYYDTVIKGLPKFFLYYDAQFCPQDHLLTLDYPLLESLTEHVGIDCIEKYLYLVALEQKFLYPIGEASIRELYGYVDYDYEEAIENICRLPLRYKLAQQFLCIPNEKLVLGENGIEKMRQAVESMSHGELLRSLRQALEKVIEEEYGSDQNLLTYLGMDLKDYVVELYNAVEFDSIRAIFPV